MAGEPLFTITGNLIKPDIRFSQNGNAVFTFTVANTPRSYDKESGGWVDQTTTWMNCVMFGKAAEHAGDSYNQGDRVIVQGFLYTEEWQTQPGPNGEPGQKRTAMKMRVEEMGISTKFHPAKSARADRAQGGQQASRPAANDDPWSMDPQVSTAAQTGGMGKQWAQSARNGFPDEPPF